MRHSPGFTLLEVLVAFAIAALALAVLYRGALDGLRTASIAGSYEEAMARARSRLAMVGHGLPLTPGELAGDDGGGYHWRIRIAPLAATAAPPGAKVPGLGLYAVSVAVSWAAEGRHREVRLDSARLTVLRPGQP
jgi:general secretion pathway protein I